MIHRFTIIKSTNPTRLTKRYALDADGKLQRGAGGAVVSGHARHASASGLRDLIAQIDALALDEAVAWGLSSRDGVGIVTKEALRNAPDLDAIARDSSHFAFPAGPGVMMLDHDPPDDGSVRLTAEELRSALVSAVPALADAPLAIRPSASSGIRRAADGVVLKGLHGWRTYVLVTDATAIPEAGARLVTLLQAAGYAWVKISASGSSLDRTLIDASVWRPEHLDFCVRAELGPGLERIEHPPMLANEAAPPLDLARITVTGDQAQAAAAATRAARNDPDTQRRASSQRAVWAIAKGKRIAERSGRPPEEEAQRLIACVEGGELPGTYVLYTEAGEEVTVADVLSDPERFDADRGERLRDPIDPDRDDRDFRIACFVWKEGRPCIYSHAGGGTLWSLSTAYAAHVFGDSVAGQLPAAPVPAFGTTATAVVAPLPGPITEDGIALVFVERWKASYRWSPGLGWMFNTGPLWERDELLRHFDDARTLCRQAAGISTTDGDKRRVASAKTVAAVVTMARADQRIVIPTEAWNADPMLLNTPGGLVDLRTGAFIARTGHYLTQITEVAPDFHAPAPVFRQFLLDVTKGDAELAGYLQRVIGYCLTGETREQAMFFLHGVGANGKSTLVDLVMWLAGSYAIKLPSKILMTTRNEEHSTGVAQLHGKRLAVSSELDEGQHFNEPLLKELTGDTVIRARFMRGDFFSFTPTQKHVIVGNYKPRLRGGDAAIARRMQLVPFDARFDAACRDPRMLEKLKAEGPAVLAWAVRGAVEWHRSGLGAPQRVREASAEYMQDHDDLQMWIEERCERSGEAKSSSLYRDYSLWKQQRGEHAPALTSWADRLGRIEGISKRKSSGILYSPISLKPIQWPGAV